MSPENVEIVRRILASWGKGDFSAGAHHFSEDVRFETFMPDTGRHATRGTTGIQAFTREWFAQWDEYRLGAIDVREAGPDKVFSVIRQLATGKHSGTEVDSIGYAVWTLRDGKVAALSLHYDEEEALRAAGVQG